MPLAVLACVLFAGPAQAAGTPAGTVIDNVASVSFELDGINATEVSNNASLTVDERIDVALVLQTPQLLVNIGDINQALLYTVANTGNGSEVIQFSYDSNLTGDDFDPVPAVPAIYFDSDGSGTLSPGDIAYDPGNNDPLLAADATLDIFLVNDIPGTALNGQIGHTELTAAAATGSGNPGDPYPGQGDGGSDAVIGGTGGSMSIVGEFLVSDITMGHRQVGSHQRPVRWPGPDSGRNAGLHDHH